MPYVTPPTFVTGNVLSASQLNTLSDNQEYLWGKISGSNPPFAMYTISAAGGATTTATKWAIVHVTNTFRYLIRLTVGTSDAVRIKYGTVTVFSDGNDHNATYDFAGTVDLTSHGFTEGQVYLVTVEFDGKTGSPDNTIEILDMREIGN